MTAITRTSPLDLGEVRKTQRRLAALLTAPEFCTCSGRRKRLPAGFCYLCSQLDPRGFHGPHGNVSSRRNRLTRRLLKGCPHLPPAPHPTFIEDDVDYYDYDDDDDGFDEESFGGELAEGGSPGGGMFDTKIVRDDDRDPRSFSLPPVFGRGKRHQDQLQRQQREQRGRGNKSDRLVPVISENTFVTTNQRGYEANDLDTRLRGTNQDQIGSSDLRLPRLSNQRPSLITEGQGQSQGEGEKRRRARDPRRLHSERIDRRVSGADNDGERFTRSDSAIDIGILREKTDPPPQPIVVSIKNQDGDLLQKIPLENFPPSATGLIPTEAFAGEFPGEEGRDKKKKLRKKKTRRDDRDGASPSPTFSGSMTISRETSLSGESPDFQFMSRLRSASWCECPDHAAVATGSGSSLRSGSESRACAECRKSGGAHERWCVSRQSLCPRCGKAFKRKYSHLERKSSFGASSSSGMLITSVTVSASGNRHLNSSSPSKRHSASQALLADKRDTQRTGDGQGGDAGEPDVTGSNRVRFREDGTVVYPEWEAFPDSGVEEGEDLREDVDGNLTNADSLKRSTALRGHGQHPVRPRWTDPDVHRKAYDLALADVKLKQMFGLTNKKKSKAKKVSTSTAGGMPHGGLYFSYFPKLAKSQQEDASQSNIGVSADSREGKQLKVKKGLKHVLGKAKLADYYPGGKNYHP